MKLSGYGHLSQRTLLHRTVMSDGTDILSAVHEWVLSGTIATPADNKFKLRTRTNFERCHVARCDSANPKSIWHMTPHSTAHPSCLKARVGQARPAAIHPCHQEWFFNQLFGGGDRYPLISIMRTINMIQVTLNKRVTASWVHRRSA